MKMGLGRHDTCALFLSGDQPLRGGRKGIIFSGDVISCMLDCQYLLYIDMESRVSM